MWTLAYRSCTLAKPHERRSVVPSGPKIDPLHFLNSFPQFIPVMPAESVWRIIDGAKKKQSERTARKIFLPGHKSYRNVDRFCACGNSDPPLGYHWATLSFF